ncbi:MAG: flagellar export protein FliJ [Gammaproteobacteria bacterium]|nr:flagellar export protein FliJ [Gammaproteobacteria bacterium]
MKRSYRLQRIVDLANTAEQAATGKLAGSEREVRGLEQQLAQLRAYRAEYETRLQHGMAPLGAYALQEYHLFMRRLDEAIEGVVKKLSDRQAQLTAQRQALVLQRRKNEILQGIQGRAAMLEDRNDQLRADIEATDRVASRVRATS